MQADTRQAGFMNKPEYKGKEKYQERNKQIYLSSAWYKAHEAWDRVLTYNDNMLEGQSYFGCAIPYQISVLEGLKPASEIQDEMSERTFNEVMFSMEMEAMFWGENLNSFFKYEEIEKNRTLTKMYYPREIVDLLGKDVLGLPKRINGEIRIIAADIAVMGGANNDAAVFTVARCLPTKTGYERQLMYIESSDGGHSMVLANRIRQLFYDFECDYLVLDTGGVGVPIYDLLTEPSIDKERGTKYDDPWTCINDEDMAKRCVYHNAKPVIYSIKGNPTLNSLIAQVFKDAMRKGSFKLPMHEDEIRDELAQYEGYDSLDKEEKLELKMPFIQTTIMVTEILNLEDENANKSDVVKIKESRSARKDKYSSISYLNYFVSEHLELKNRNIQTDVDPSKIFMIKQASRRASRSGTYL